MIATVMGDISPSTYTYVFILGLLCAIPFLLGRLRGRLDLFEPIYAVAVAYFGFFGFRALMLVNEPRLTAVAMNLLLINTSTYLLLGLQYVIGGMVALLLGYYSGLGGRLAQLAPQPSWMRGCSISLGRVTIVFLIGFGVQMFLSSGGYGIGAEGSVADMLSQIAFLGYYGLALGWVKLLVDRGVRTTLLVPTVVGMAVAEIGYVVAGGQRQYILLLLAILVIGLHYFSRRFSTRQLLLGGCLFAFVIFPLTEQWRQVYWFSPQMETEQPDAAQAYRQAFEELTATGTLGEYLRGAAVTFSNRLHGMDSLMLALYKTPATIPFFQGETLRNIAVGVFVPRFLWPGKPKVYISDFFAREYWGLPPHIHAAIAVSQIGELYINYGLGGVLIGLFCLGVIYRALYVYLMVRAPRSYATIMYIIAFHSVIIIDREFAVLYGTLIKHLAVLVVLGKMVMRRDRPAAAPAGLVPRP